MISEDLLQDLLSDGKYSQTIHILFCVAFKHPDTASVGDIKKVAAENGLRRVTTWPISSRLSGSAYAVKTKAGWKLNSKGQAYISKLLGPLAILPLPKIATTLRSHLDNVKDDNSRKFLTEAIACFESRLWRAAVVFTWVGAVSILQDHVLVKKLAVFNAAGQKRFSKNWRDVKSKDDFSRLREADFLQVAYECGAIGKPIWLELKGCLTLRNNCGHPNTFSVGENRASGHIESLIDNVFARLR